MTKRSLRIRLFVDAAIALLGLTLFFGTWFYLGVLISAVQRNLLQSLGASLHSPEVLEAFHQAHHGFDGYRLVFSSLGLVFVLIGCFLWAADARREASSQRRHR